MKRSSLPTSIARRCVGLTLALGLSLAPLPTLAAPPAEEATSGDADAGATVGGNVAILKFTGDDYKANDFRGRVQNALTEQGYTANFIKRSIDEAKDKNKCKDLTDSCLEKIGAYLNKNSSTAYDFYAWAVVPGDGTATIVIYDIAKKKKVVELSMLSSPQDYILPEVIGGAVARRLVESQSPAAGASEEEKQILATLDEPEETPEEIAAREAAVRDAMEEAGMGVGANIDVGAQAVDLREDFDEFCRTGKREDKVIEGDDGETSKERDLRPPCKRGPVFGYWQPRSWVALTLTLGSAATMGTMYGLAAASRGKWSTAKANLDASGLSATDPYDTCDGNTCYEDLAGQVSAASAEIRRRAIVGDVFLGATVLLTGVLAIIIYQDRQAAKDFIAHEKELRALSNLRIGPVFGESNGAALSFDF